LRQNRNARSTETVSDGFAEIVLTVPDGPDLLAGACRRAESNRQDLDVWERPVENEERDVGITKVRALRRNDCARDGCWLFAEVGRCADVDGDVARVVLGDHVDAIRRTPVFRARYRSRRVLRDAVAGGEDYVGRQKRARAQLEGAACTDPKRHD